MIFKITPSDDHPVDLYFVMDLSNSMKTYQENLVGASLAIAEKIRNTTTKFRASNGAAKALNEVFDQKRTTLDQE